MLIATFVALVPRVFNPPVFQAMWIEVKSHGSALDEVRAEVRRIGDARLITETIRVIRVVKPR